MKLALTISVSAAAAIALFSMAQPANTAGGAAAIVNQPAQQLPWKEAPTGAAFAGLWGDMQAGEFGAMVRVPAGESSPMHIHTTDMHGIVVSGTFAHLAQGADATSEIELPSGSYYLLPGKLPHVSKCVSEIDCVTFIYQPGKFDFVPTARN